MEIKIKLNGRKLVPCTKCGVFHKANGNKKTKLICSPCKKEVAV